MHAAQEAEVVGVFRDVGEGLGNPQAALAARFELGGGRDQLAFAWPRFAGVGDELGLVIKGVEVRRAALHREEDDAFGAGGEVRRLGQERALVRRRRTGAEAREGEIAEAGGDALEHVAAREGEGLEVGAIEGAVGEVHDWGSG